MNILIAVPWDQTLGGVASVVGNLACFLQKQGHSVFFLHPIFLHQKSSVFFKKRLTKSGFPGYKLKLIRPLVTKNPIRNALAFSIFFPITLIQMLYILVKHRIQIVNVHYPIESFVYIAVCRWILPIKLVISIHGADFFPNGKKRKRYSNEIRLLLFSSDLIVAPSKAFINDFLKLFPNVKGKCAFIHNSVNLSELNYSFIPPATDCEDKYILCIANYNIKKGLDVLINAFSTIKGIDPLLKLFLVGDGTLRWQLEELARSLKVYDRIKFLGDQGRNEVVRLLHECELFVLPSRSEPFGIVILEAMACKKPIIASAVGGIPEIIENGWNGILVEPDNPLVLARAMESVLRNHGLRNMIASNGYNTVVERFSHKHNGTSYEKLFHLVTSQKRSKTGALINAGR